MELAAESHDAVGIARGHGPAVLGDDIAELLEFPGRDGPGRPSRQFTGQRRLGPDRSRISWRVKAEMRFLPLSRRGLVTRPVGGKVTDAIERAPYFIVVLSPHAAASKWVNKEVDYWLRAHGPHWLLFRPPHWTVAQRPPQPDGEDPTAASEFDQMLLHTDAGDSRRRSSSFSQVNLCG
ncbi:hypothetical protein [Nocardia lijiangensis]|uniref:hypothetical protein n=1 Tax=Nocardia lijiangensis TaxID=299618 RepID=UPI003D765504